MTEDRKAKSCGQVVLRAGRRITRGSERGTCTMAVPFGRPKASVPFQRDQKIETLVQQLRKRMCGIQPDRAQQRKQFA